MATFRMAADEIVSLMSETKAKFHPHLVDAGVTICVREAFGRRNEKGELVGPTLTHGGYPALARVLVTSHKDRVAGLADAIIDIDGDRWTEHDQARKIAIVDHELCHLELVLDDEGAVKLDDCFRPRLRIRKHDSQIGSFDQIIHRHGKASVEAEQIFEAAKPHQQLLFNWG